MRGDHWTVVARSILVRSGSSVASEALAEPQSIICVSIMIYPFVHIMDKICINHCLESAALHILGWRIKASCSVWLRSVCHLEQFFSKWTWWGSASSSRSSKAIHWGVAMEL